VQLSINNALNVSLPPRDGVDIVFDPPFEEHPRKYNLPQGRSSRELEDGTMNNYTYWLGVYSYNSRLAWRNVSIELPSNTSIDLPEEERTLNVSRFGWVYPMPIDRDWVDSFGRTP
jgi:hypothetical protein